MNKHQNRYITFFKNSNGKNTVNCKVCKALIIIEHYEKHLICTHSILASNTCLWCFKINFKYFTSENIYAHMYNCMLACINLKNDELANRKRKRLSQIVDELTRKVARLESKVTEINEKIK
ncbi:hypothetical protein GpSGHVEth154 [Glossina pallidipes salivary gland hypertrophy virus]|uniref:Uncharacterized protein n=2 Tax=Glossina hytrovirus (isolate Glossina pallidipes/Ethiopia/Seibersdorf/-) TaxID=379529 RepID=A0A0Y0LT74_GHVS|nr:hypothetical protein SGHV138 [Glossina pallidipes salivary gland hypertrophy virus]ABQ08911.1 hypothetical protein SGHV138 [Glossina pallidipes salivary gland hypertrophy virus]AMB48758.1 hypothetical protein GpSGHVEth154 [Glossina pallidipes salivary gland hypertrophy virus]